MYLLGGLSTAYPQVTDRLIHIPRSQLIDQAGPLEKRRRFILGRICWEIDRLLGRKHHPLKSRREARDLGYVLRRLHGRRIFLLP